MIFSLPSSGRYLPLHCSVCCPDGTTCTFCLALELLSTYLIHSFPPFPLMIPFCVRPDPLIWFGLGFLQLACWEIKVLTVFCAVKLLLCVKQNKEDKSEQTSLECGLGWHCMNRKESQFYRADSAFYLYSDWMKKMCQNQSGVGIFIVFIICLV